MCTTQATPPALVSGVMRVNLTILANAPVGAQVPILVTVGSAASRER